MHGLFDSVAEDGREGGGRSHTEWEGPEVCSWVLKASARTTVVSSTLAMFVSPSQRGGVNCSTRTTAVYRISRAVQRFSSQK